jgi:hypothetical protein
MGNNVHGDSGSNFFGEERCLSLLEEKIFVVIAFCECGSGSEIVFKGVWKKPSFQ